MFDIFDNTTLKRDLGSIFGIILQGNTNLYSNNIKPIKTTVNISIQ